MPGGLQAVVGGRPCRNWLDLFVLTHHPCTDGWRRLEWPDGRCLLEQTWLLVSIFYIIDAELAAVARERMRKDRARKQGWLG